MWDMRYIWHQIRYNNEVLAGLGLTGASSVEIANTIIKRKVSPDQLASGSKRLCIYFVPSRKGLIEIVSENLVQIDCHIPNNIIGPMDVCHNVLDWCWGAVKDQTIIVAVDDKPISGIKLEWEGFLGDVYSSTSHYSAAIRLKYTSIVY